MSSQKIKKEKLLAGHILANPFSSMHQAFARSAQIASGNRFDAVTREQLIEYVSHLEGILKSNQIEFKSLTERSNP